jgi:hypothetical protein
VRDALKVKHEAAPELVEAVRAGRIRARRFTLGASEMP